MKDPKTRQLPIRQPRGPPVLQLLKRKPTAKYPGSLNFAYRTQQENRSQKVNNPKTQVHLIPPILSKLECSSEISDLELPSPKNPLEHSLIMNNSSYSIRATCHRFSAQSSIRSEYLNDYNSVFTEDVKRVDTKSLGRRAGRMLLRLSRDLGSR